MTTVRDTALLWASRGACVLPTMPDGSKSPTKPWKCYEWDGKGTIPTPPSAQIMGAWFPPQQRGLGLILGAVSGDLEMLELEGRAISEGYLAQLARLAADNGLTEVWSRLCAGYMEKTPLGGLHWIYRLSNGRALRNTKLARRPASAEELVENPNNKIRVLIETRGEGGHVVIAPSHGPTHLTGEPWVVLNDAAPATLTVAERDQLFAVCRMLNTVADVERPMARAWAEHGDVAENPFAMHHGDISPLDDFSTRVDWADILEPAGWSYSHHESGTDYWLRPGKDKSDKGWGHSASTGWASDATQRSLMYVWSTSTDLPDGISMTKGTVFAHLNHGGDLAEATKALRAQGFGTPRRKPQRRESEYAIQRDARIADQESRGYFLPDEFWNDVELPAFAHLRRAAWSRLACPAAVLVSAMVRTVAHIGPQVVVPPWVGSKASLNFGTVIVGDSGASKSSSVGVAEEALEFTDLHAQRVGLMGYHTFCPSSPQGIAGQYQKYVRGNIEQTRISAVCDVDEGDQLRAVWEKQGIGIIAELRKALMGKSLGFGNVGETRTNLAAHSYRFAFTLCTLPTHADWIVGDEVGGFPQRLIWACAEDARLFDEKWPGIFQVRVPPGCQVDHVIPSVLPWVELGVDDPEGDDRIKNEVIAENMRRIELGLAPGDLDGHAVLTREKVAWIFALMHGRTTIRHDVEWRAAGVFMASSNATRAYVLGRVAEKNATEAKQAAVGRGKSKAIEEVTYGREIELRARVSKRILDYLAAEPGLPKSDLYRRFKGADGTRALIGNRRDPQVLDALLQSGQVRYEDIVKNDKVIGSRWFLAGYKGVPDVDPFA